MLVYQRLLGFYTQISTPIRIRLSKMTIISVTLRFGMLIHLLIDLPNNMLNYDGKD